MSTLTKILNLFFLFLFLPIIAQNVNMELQVIKVDLSSKILASYDISKDSTSAAFNIYINGYECKKKREKAMAEFEQNTSFTSPNFIISFSATRLKAIKNLDGLKLVNVEDFAKGNLSNTTPCYILYKYKNNYVIWQAVALPQE